MMKEGKRRSERGNEKGRESRKEETDIRRRMKLTSPYMQYAERRVWLVGLSAL
jgi:hypothetical protein